MATIYGGKVNSVWRAYLTYSVSSTATTTTISFTAGINVPNSGYKTTRKYTSTTSATGKSSVVGTRASSTITGVKTVAIKSGSFTYNRTTANQTVTIANVLKGGGESTTSSCSASITIPARTSYSVTFKADNTSEASTFLTQTGFYYGYAKALTTSVPEKADHSFKGWTTTAGGTTVNYTSGQSVTLYANLTLYPIWQEMYPPTCDNNGVTDVGKSGQPYSKWLKKFSSVQTTVSNIDIHTGRELSTIQIICSDGTNTDTGTYTHTSGEPTPETVNVNVTPTTSGEKTLTLKITDSAGLETTYPLDDITVSEATWKQTVTYLKATYLAPDIDKFGNAIIEVYAKNSSNTYDLITSNVPITETETAWSFDVELSEDYVSSDASATPTSYIKVEYDHTETDEKDYVKAFFNTTRNANYSTGLSNTMFVSGSTSPNYTSRVWWSYVNNPLYFPDTNYVEVGSNDTSVMGLCKVGDYLGAIKQSKTTDTAIYLLYATSFDDDTTFAVKQGVQGVGALGKYSFNVLGDETLFLSPNGVMAIVPSEDEEHKVQNRSFFVDGKLLSEEGLTESYSFVFDGMYWLSTGNHCYVLDGNQKNSWGNDKTNLVYEAYFLDNIPADCFMKYNEELWFSNSDYVCKMRNTGDTDEYVDAYQHGTTNTNVNVSAEWSTILDDDGSLHYYKTMVKKGCVASIFPMGGDAYVATAVTEEEFNADKTKYYILVDDEYVQCTSESVYSSTETYYVVNVTTSAKVYIKKDAEEPILVGEINGEVEETGDIPNELHIRKKVKKYKRLQFILKNEKNEGFGVDSITKSYYLGNYAK